MNSYDTVFKNLILTLKTLTEGGVEWEVKKETDVRTRLVLLGDDLTKYETTLEWRFGSYGGSYCWSLTGGDIYITPKDDSPIYLFQSQIEEIKDLRRLLIDKYIGDQPSNSDKISKLNKMSSSIRKSEQRNINIDIVIGS